MTPPAPDETRDLPPGQSPPGADVPAPVARAERLGRFELRRVLGAGAFGRVYEAFDPRLERPVALKVAKPESLGVPERRQLFLDEAKAVANLRHPHIVPVYDSGADAGRYYIASAFISGGTLEDEIHTVSVATHRPARRAAEVAWKLAEALGYAHSRGIVHRDVKPANVMVDEAGEPLIADFGLAARAGGAVAHGGAGTPQYMAPEQWAGRPVAASDQYALGCTLYKLLTGDAPFGNTAPAQQEYLHTHQPPEPPRALNPSVPRDLQAICLKALAKTPAGRYPGCQELADDLRRWLNGEPVRARRAGLLERAVRWARRKPAAAGLVGALAVILIGSAVAALWYARAVQVRGENRDIAARDLDTADESLRRDDREGARQALGRAKGRLEAAGADSLRPRYEWLENQLAFAAELEDVRDQSLLMTGSEPATAGEKPPPRSTWSGVVVRPVGAKYSAAFERQGWRLDDQDAGAIARAIDDSPVRAKIVEAMYHWFGNDPPRRPALDRVLDQMAPGHAWPRAWRRYVTSGTEFDHRPVISELSPHDLRCSLLLAQNATEIVGQMRADGRPTKAPDLAAAALVYQAREAYPDDFSFNLFAAGAALTARPPRPEEALGFARAALALRPQSSAAVYLNGYILLEGQQNPPAALPYLIRAVALQPAHVGAHTALGMAYQRMRDYPAAVRSHQAAIELDPNFAILHNNLSATLHASGDLAGAIAAARRAVELGPDFARAHNNLGMYLDAQGNRPEAIRCLRRAVELGPDEALNHFNLGAVLRRAHLDECIRCYRRAVELDPGYAVAFNNLGSALDERGDRADAITAFERAVALEPQNADYHSNLGDTLRAAGKYAAGLAEIRKAIELDPSRPAYHNNLGAAFTEVGDHTAAAAAFEKAVALDGSFTEGRINLGVSLLKSGRTDRAAEVLRAVVAKEPSSARARYNLGAALIALKDWPHAAEELTAATRADPKYAQAFNDLGSVYRALGKPAEARAAFERAAQANALFAAPHINLADLLLALGDADGAVRECRTAIALVPKSVEAHNNLAAALAQKKDTAAAIAAAKRAVELGPNIAQVHRTLADLCLGAGDSLQARASFRRAVELDPRDTTSQLALAVGYIRDNDFARAAEVLRAAVKASPGHGSYYFYLGHACFMQNKIDDAVAAYREGVRVDPKNPLLRTGLGMCLMKRGDFAGAADAYRAAVDLASSNGDAWNSLGMCRMKTGEFGEAVRAFEAAQKHGSNIPNYKFPAEPLERAKKLAALDATLDEVAAGRKTPRDAEETADYALLCLDYKKRYALAAKLFTAAFTSSPKLAERYRVQAAQAAVWAAARTNAPRSTAEEIDRLRGQALDWLGAEQEACRKDIAAGGKPADAARSLLKELSESPDFASVRDAALDELPAEQARGWRAFWKSVADALPPRK